jgi:hypothetical protein
MSQTDTAPIQSLPLFTVSAFNRRSGRPLIWHCEAEDARAARDLVLLRMRGAAAIVSVFAGHLTEPDEPVWLMDGAVPSNQAAGKPDVDAAEIAPAPPSVIDA